MNRSLTEYQLELAGDPIRLDTYVRGLRDFASLDEVEQARFDFLMRALLERVSMAIEARESGLVETLADEIEERGIEGRILLIASEPGFRTWWDTRGFCLGGGKCETDIPDAAKSGRIVNR